MWSRRSLAFSKRKNPNVGCELAIQVAAIDWPGCDGVGAS